MANTTSSQKSKKTSAKRKPAKRTTPPKARAKTKAKPRAKAKPRTKATPRTNAKTKAKAQPKDHSPSPLLSLPSLLWRHSHTLLFALTGSILCIAAFDVAQHHHTPATPKLLHNDLILVDQLTTTFSTPQPGDAVLVRQRATPNTPTSQTMARVLALGGSTYAWNQHSLSIDDTPFTHTPPPSPPPDLKPLDRTRSIAFAPVLNNGSIPIGSALSDAPPPPLPKPSPTAHFTVPRHHALVLIQPPPSTLDPSPPLQARVIPQGDILGVGRIVLSHLGPSKRWQDFIPHPLR